MKLQHLLLILSFSFFYGCESSNVISKEEMEIQNKSDAVVSATLFENNLTEKASYNIRTDGSVSIKFSESVSIGDYTRVVKLLRSNSAIKRVYAEQSGREVCPFR